MLRTTRRLTLTEFGLQLLDHARQVAAEVDAVKALSEYRQARHTDAPLSDDMLSNVIASLARRAKG